MTIDYPNIGQLWVDGKYTRDIDGAGEPEENYEVYSVDTDAKLDIDLIEKLCLAEIHREAREYDPT